MLLEKVTAWLVAFSGSVQDGGEEYTEPKLNVRPDGSHIGEAQTKAEFLRRWALLKGGEGT